MKHFDGTEGHYNLTRYEWLDMQTNPERYSKEKIENFKKIRDKDPELDTPFIRRIISWPKK